MLCVPDATDWSSWLLHGEDLEMPCSDFLSIGNRFITSCFSVHVRFRMLVCAMRDIEARRRLLGMLVSYGGLGNRSAEQAQKGNSIGAVLL